MDRLYQSDALSSEGKVSQEKRVARRHVVNSLNYCNFQGKTILIFFRHKEYHSTITLEVVPQPCFQETFECTWSDHSTAIKLRAYDFSHIFIDDEKRLIYCKPAVQKILDSGIIFSLEDEYYYEIPSATVRHHPGNEIVAEIAQHGIMYRGSLLDFSSDSFKLRLDPEIDNSFQLLNLETAALITLRDGGCVFYSEECAISEYNHEKQGEIYILKPLANNISRLSPKRYRSKRVAASFLCISYKHPITAKTRTFKIRDISGSGFSLEQFYHNSDLIPGMILPSVEIQLANFRIVCMAQVVYKNILPSEENTVCCGLAFLNMTIKDQASLATLLYQMQNTNTYVLTTVDLDRLWKFFFDSDFIYPQKYVRIQERKDQFKATYEKIYNNDNDIAQYFIYQDKGEIYAHIAMIRAYENTWLIHHHASNRITKKAGFEVLKHVGEYINDFHSLFSTHMHYVMCYYRPDNRYPHRVFGGCAAYFNNRQASSLDSFAYLIIPANERSAEPSTFGLQISPATNEDIDELVSFYDNIAGGLTLRALHLEEVYKEDNLGQCYEKNGLQRNSRPLSIRRDNTLLAIALVNISEVGLNLSNLTHCIHLFILNKDLLPPDALFSVLSSLSEHYYQMEEVAVLLYPAVYAEQHDIAIEKIYNLWVLSMNYTDLYFDYINKLFKSREVKD
jgi:hypothetical protein